MSITDAVSRPCAACGEMSPLESNWCEACGADLDAAAVTAKRPCVSCGAAADEVTDDGWCQICGSKQPHPADHVVADHGWFAVVSDRGRAHHTNEDAGAVAARPDGVVVVVCDGVSSTERPELAAQAAVRILVAALQSSPPDRATAIRCAADAQAAIVALTPPTAVHPPSCTMVTVVADIDGAHADLSVAWLGDSRAYWIADGAATQLSADHNWAQEQLALGELDPAAIRSDPRAASITRWLGADSDDVEPETITKRVALPGMVLVCSDGLWGYTTSAEALYELTFAGPVDETPLARAERLVAFANAQGGRDNITVAIATLAPRTGPVSPIESPTISSTQTQE